MGVISKHRAAIDLAGAIASTDLPKPRNVAVTPLFGAYFVESTAPDFERLPLFSRMT